MKPGTSQNGHPHQTQKLQIRRRTKKFFKRKKIKVKKRICLVTVFNARFHSQERDLVWIWGEQHLWSNLPSAWETSNSISIHSPWCVEKASLSFQSMNFETYFKIWLNQKGALALALKYFFVVAHISDSWKQHQFSHTVSLLATGIKKFKSYVILDQNLACATLLLFSLSSNSGIFYHVAGAGKGKVN